MRILSFHFHFLSVRFAHPSTPPRIHRRSSFDKFRPRSTVQTSCSLNSPRIFIFGLGYTGVALANALGEQGWSVSGTARFKSQATTSLCDTHPTWQLHPWDPAANRSHLSDAALEDLGNASHVLSCIPPLGLPLYDPVFHAQMKLLPELSNCSWLGYLSSTGVYGNWDGAWVDESTEPAPVTQTGYIRYEHEKEWQRKADTAPVHIFRLGGIYGPGRSMLDTVQKGQVSQLKQARATKQYISRCHVLDICQVLQASIARPDPGNVYNVVDDLPASRERVQQLALQLLGLPQDQETPAGESCNSHSEDSRQQVGKVRQRNKDEKRVRNTKIKEQLGVVLKYPSYKEGLAAIHAGDIQPFSQGDLRVLC